MRYDIYVSLGAKGLTSDLAGGECLLPSPSRLVPKKDQPPIPVKWDAR